MVMGDGGHHGGSWWWVKHQDLKRECSDGGWWLVMVATIGGSGTKILRGSVPMAVGDPRAVVAHFSAVAPIVSNQMVGCWVSVNPPSLRTLEPTSKKSGLAENHKGRVSAN